MNFGDLHKVWEIRTLKRMPKEEEAQKILEKVANHVQPIMRKHKWRVKLLSEFCPKNASLLGVNVGAGLNVKLRLRRPNRNEEFIPFHEVLDTMLHELCHNAHGPHNASFYKLWDEIREECEDFINKGISGSGQGFDLPGKRLGGVTRNSSISSLRQATLTAAENRARLRTLLPSGPKQIGGDSLIMVSLSPSQAAAMAAEMRLHDNIWCGSEVYDGCEGDENTPSVPNLSDSGHSSKMTFEFHGRDKKTISRKRSHESGNSPGIQSCSDNPASISLSLLKTFPTSSLSHPIKRPCNKIIPEECKSDAPTSCGDQRSNFVDLEEVSTSQLISTQEPLNNEKYDMWPCSACTLLNTPVAPICNLCRTPRPMDNNHKYCVWLCKFCTLENDVRLEKCSACEAWRYSYGSPVAAPAPNLGT